MADVGRGKGMCVSMPEDWQEAIRADSSRRGQSISQWLREATCDRLPGDVVRQLSDPVRPGPYHRNMVRQFTDGGVEIVAGRKYWYVHGLKRAVYRATCDSVAQTYVYFRRPGRHSRDRVVPSDVFWTRSEAEKVAGSA